MNPLCPLVSMCLVITGVGWAIWGANRNWSVRGFRWSLNPNGVVMAMLGGAVFIGWVVSQTLDGAW